MKPVTKPFRRREFVILALILLVAAALRLGQPGITEFKRDEANLSQLALNLARGREFPLLGISSSVGVPNPPINVYLFALPYLLDDSPIPATLFVGFLNVIAVWLTWWLARRYYGPTAATMAGLLYAVSPWAVLYSRKIWAQDLLPPFVVVTVFTGLLGFGEGKRWARWLHWPLLIITIQIHYGAFTLIPLTLLMLVLWPKFITRRGILIGLAAAALTIVPVVIGAYQADLLSVETLRKGLDQESDQDRPINSTALDYAWFVVAGKNIHSLAGPEQFQNYLDSVPDVWSLFNVIPVGALITAGYLIWRKRTRLSPDMVLIAWMVLPVLAFTWQWTEVSPHYMIPLMPAAFILCGVGAQILLDAFGSLSHPKFTHVSSAAPELSSIPPAPSGPAQPGWRKGERRADQVPSPTGLGRGFRGGDTGLYLLLLLIVGLQGFMFMKLLHFVDTHATPGGFGTPLHDLLHVRETVLDRDPASVIVVSEGEVAPYDQEPAVWSVLLDSVPDVRFVNGTQTAVIPASGSLELIAWSPALKICAADDCLKPDDHTSIFETRPGESPYILRSAGTWTASITEIDPVRFANGAYLMGYGVESDSVLLEYRLSGPVDEEFQAYVHVVDADGQRLGQHDRWSWPGWYWCADDRLYLWFDVDISPEAATLFAGMYTINGAETDTVEVLDSQGAYLAQDAEIALEN